MLQISGDFGFVFALPAGQLKIFLYGEVAENASAFRRMGDAGCDNLVGGKVSQIFAGEGDASGVGGQTGDRAKDGGLARAVCADQRDDFSAGHLKRNTVNGLDAVVMDA